jgi:alpha-L-fucosidase
MYTYLDSTMKINHVIIQEDIVFGERFRKNTLEGKINGKWIQLANGTSIGYKRIERFDAVEVSSIRIRFLNSSFPPVIKNMAAYYVANLKTKTSILN